MVTDFLSLIDKVNQLSELAQTLRRENAELRLRCVEVEDENAQLVQRMQQAHERVTTLLEKIPVPAVPVQAASMSSSQEAA